MSNFELWVKGCEENNTLIYLLEGSGENGLYKLTKEIWINHNIFYDNPIFIGWVNGEQVVVSNDYVSAYQIWRKRTDGKV